MATNPQWNSMYPKSPTSPLLGFGFNGSSMASPASSPAAVNGFNNGYTGNGNSNSNSNSNSAVLCTYPCRIWSLGL